MTPRNVIFMISDGMSPSSMSFARVALNRSLYLDDHLVGTVKTFSAESAITDSAAGATTYSCGFKTCNQFVGATADTKACGTVMEAAKKRGMLTGVVVTSRVTHATPAAYSSHCDDRDAEEFIGAQQVLEGMDVILGGGLAKYNFSSLSGNNSLNVAEKLNYHIAYNIDQMNAISSLPILGLFNAQHMDYEIDRNPAVEPSLSQMTAKALQLLEQDPNFDNGFFLMVEGSRIDMAAHNKFLFLPSFSFFINFLF